MLVDGGGERQEKTSTGMPHYLDFGQIRRSEFSRLDESGNVYLDFTGSALYPRALIDRQDKLLRNNVLGNPHSSNPASVVATAMVERTRARILEFFHAPSTEYTVVFTSNATAAIKLVGESFPFAPESTFALLADNHNSVHGIREFAHAAKASIRYLSIDSHLRVADVHDILSQHHPNVPNLFAFPAQSNFSGVKHSLSFVRCAHNQRWFVLLDAAAYVPTSPLDLSQVHPDFVSISFYKMFGLPTGVGALIARKSSLNQLRRPWFAGGTVRFSAVGANVHSLVKGAQGFEDGTVNFLSIALVKDGLDFLDSIGMANIHHHIAELTRYILIGMDHLRYHDGSHIVQIYGPRSTHRRGGCISFDILSPRGERRDPRSFEAAANKRKISIRVGCFCNPGAAERALRRNYKRERSCLLRAPPGGVDMDFMSNCMGEYLGCIRVSLGIPTNKRDIDFFVNFLKEFALSTRD